MQREALPALALGAEHTLDAEAEFGVALFEAQTERGDLHAKIEGSDTQMRSSEALARLLEARAEP